MTRRAASPVPFRRAARVDWDGAGVTGGGLAACRPVLEAWRRRGRMIGVTVTLTALCTLAAGPRPCGAGMTRRAASPLPFRRAARLGPAGAVRA